MIQYEFKISAVECTILEDGMSNVINLVHYRYLGTNENGILGETYGVITLPAPSFESFTTFNDVTSEMVIGWLNTILSSKKEEESISQLELLQQSIENEINLKENPVTITLQLLN